MSLSLRTGSCGDSRPRLSGRAKLDSLSTSTKLGSCHPLVLSFRRPSFRPEESAFVLAFRRPSFRPEEPAFVLSFRRPSFRPEEPAFVLSFRRPSFRPEEPAFVLSFRRPSFRPEEPAFVLSFRRPSFRPEESAFVLSFRRPFFGLRNLLSLVVPKTPRTHGEPPDDKKRTRTTPHLHGRRIPRPLLARARSTRGRQKASHPPPPSQRLRTPHPLVVARLLVIHDRRRHLPGLDRRSLENRRVD